MGTLANNRNIHKKPRNIRKGENNEYPKRTKHKRKTTQQRNEPGRLRHGPDHLAPAFAGYPVTQGWQVHRGLRQPHFPQPRLPAQPDRAGKTPARDPGVSARNE